MNHSVQMGYNSDGDVKSKAVAITGGEGSLNTDVTVPGNTNDKLVEMQFAAARLKSIYILSDKALTLETNSSSAADDTFAIAANVPFCWIAGSGIECPFSADVTAFYFSNAGSAAATVYIRGAKDSTP